MNTGDFAKDDRQVAREILSMSLSYDDRYLVTGSADRMIRIYMIFPQ